MSRRNTSVTERDVKNFVSFAKKNPLAALVLVAVIAGFLIWQGVSENRNKVTVPMDGLYVHYIDVGQGDCELVCCGGEYMLIDAGEPSASDTVVDYLKNHSIEKLAYLVCTHPHADHCGGLDAVVENFEVETVFTTPYVGENRSYEYFENAVYDAGLELTVPEMGESFRLGEAVFRFIGPLEDHDSTNDDSLVIRLEYGDTSFLFTGDMSSAAERELIADGAELSCDVLKVGHHGSSSSSCYQFLYETDPTIAVISCGEGNDYGHPHKETMSRLADAEVTVYRTDTDGSIIIFSDGMHAERRTA